MKISTTANQDESSLFKQDNLKEIDSSWIKGGHISSRLGFKWSPLCYQKWMNTLEDEGKRDMTCEAWISRAFASSTCMYAVVSVMLYTACTACKPS